MANKKVLFVGSFKDRSTSGGVGGQMFACRSLVESDLKIEFDWIKIDTTAESNLKIPTHRKIPKVFKRLLSFMFQLLFKRPDFVLVFTSNGLSFKEKGLMIILAKTFSKAKVILAPRSGRLKEELLRKPRGFSYKVFKKADLIICQGESWKDFFIQLYPQFKGKFLVQKNWIDQSKYVPTNYSNEKVNVLFLAWIDREKGIFDLLESIERLNKDHAADTIYHIAGKGKDEQKLKQEIEKKGLASNVVIHGWVLGDEKIELLSNCDIFVLPSYFEGLPNSLLESMASGLACISTNVGAIPDVIVDDYNGLLINAKDIDALTNSLKILILDKSKRENIGLNARHYITKEHSLETAIETFKERILIK